MLMGGRHTALGLKLATKAELVLATKVTTRGVIKLGVTYTKAWVLVLHK